MNKIIRLVAVLALALLASACTSYRFIPPASDAGRQCVTLCETNRQICIAGKEQLAAGRTQACETQRNTQLAMCLALAPNPFARAQCTSKKAPHCSSHADTSACDSGHRACYVQCGGRVIEVED